MCWKSTTGRHRALSTLEMWFAINQPSSGGRLVSKHVLAVGDILFRNISLSGLVVPLWGFRVPAAQSCTSTITRPFDEGPHSKLGQTDIRSCRREKSMANSEGSVVLTTIPSSSLGLVDGGGCRITAGPFPSPSLKQKGVRILSQGLNACKLPPPYVPEQDPKSTSGHCRFAPFQPCLGGSGAPFCCKLSPDSIVLNLLRQETWQP